MHSTIYEIRENCISPEEWANESAIADNSDGIVGVDYYDRINDERKRCERIVNLFNSFPEGHFLITGNEPGKTASIRFAGGIDLLYNRWVDEIREKAGLLRHWNPDDSPIHDVCHACAHPFGLKSKFYMPGWCYGITGTGSFLLYLNRLYKENDGMPFFLYIGQVFDYHY